MKKIALLLAVAMLLTMLAACGQKTPDTSDTSSDESTNTTVSDASDIGDDSTTDPTDSEVTDNPTTSGNSGNAKTTVKTTKKAENKNGKLKSAKVSLMLAADKSFYASADSEEEPNAFHRLFQYWEKTYGEEIELITVAWDYFSTYLTTGAAAGEMPDVCYGGPIWFPNWPANKLTQALDGYLNLKDSMWNKEIMDQLTLGGKHYVAYGQSPEKFYIVYNATKFDQAGETTPLEWFQKGKWTWTQFVKTAKNMTDALNDEYGLTGWGMTVANSIYPLTEKGKNDKFTLSINNTKVVRWLTETGKLSKDGVMRIEGAANWGSTFRGGKDAMVMITPEDYVRIRQYVDVVGGDEFGIAPMPVFDPNGETVSKTSANVYGLSITSKSKNPEAAAELINQYFVLWNSINDKLGTFGLMEKYLTKAEKKALLDVDKTPVTLNYLTGIGKCRDICSKLAPLSDPSDTTPAQTVIDQVAPLLQAEINEFYRALGK